MGEFSGKVALITGAGSGMGAATAHRLASAGASVLVVDRDVEAANTVVKSGEGTLVAHQADVSDPEACQGMVAAAVETFGCLHIAINNAGITGPVATVVDISLEDWHQVLSINLSGVFYGMRAEIPEIIRAGGGAIVNTASTMGLSASTQGSAYVAAKHGVIGLTKAAAMEYGAAGVRVNAVCPGAIRTPMMDDYPEEITAAYVAGQPIPRVGQPEEAAELFAFLASDRSSFSTGAYFVIDGGRLAG